jgi:hypothetical protein
MGQWPSILAPPSFHSQLLPPVPQNEFVPSAEFSTGIDDQWAWLYNLHTFRYSPGLVTSIKRHPGQGFDVTWKENGSTYQVHAAATGVLRRGRRVVTMGCAVYRVN